MTRLSMFILAVSSIMLSRFGNSCYGANEQSVSAFQQQLVHLEDLWEAGHTSEYYFKARTMVKDVVAQGGTGDVTEVAARIFESLLPKLIREEQAGTENLFAMEELAKLLITDERVSLQERRVRVRLLSQFFGYIREEWVPDFKPLPVYANVSPPPGTPGMAGMRPEAIADPIARAEYEEKIRQNHQNALMNRRQAALANIERRISEPIMEYIKMSRLYFDD